MGRLIVVTGTGTGIGKTHVSEAVLLALAKLASRVAGIKPVETGIDPTVLSDAERLRKASTFHVQQSTYQFVAPVSPHLAAREANSTIQFARIESYVSQTKQATDVTLVELAGGLFTPLADSLLNLDVARQLGADYVLLVAPDRLGVLHDVIATTRAAEAAGLSFSGIAVVAQEGKDASMGTNVSELLRFVPHLPVFAVARRNPDELSSSTNIAALARDVVRPAPR